MPVPTAARRAILALALCLALPTLAETPAEAPPATEDQAPVSLPPQIYPNGALCGDPGVTGSPLPPIRGAVPACSILEPVQVTGVAGVALSKPVNLDCPTARALRLWVERDVIPELSVLGGGLARLDIAGGYHCRPVNFVRGGHLSEHGKGRAIDITGFTLKNGQSIRVLGGWRSKAQGGVLRALHDAACGPFGTVLGPDADRHHQDHFHVDTKQRPDARKVCQ